MVEVIWSEISFEDLYNIIEFISRDSGKYASLQAEKIIGTTNLLEHSALVGKPVREFDDPSIREIVCGNYRIIYEVISKSSVLILTIHHGKRLVENNPAFKKKK
ncbi:MAG: type II toxin-antitoxin system RelE/ParE family toxin [Chitinophagales bacterium]|nr:type II toxin-antitoxin system RelE/ParE family toxin [Chitinophagales bacterium]